MFRTSYDSPGQNYTLYYDESNNHRKFYINADNNSYNVDNDPDRKRSAGTNFLLAGVAHRGDSYTADLPALFESLRLPKTARELKFSLVAWGTFDVALKSARLKTFLQWTLDNDLYIHYFVLNMEYWGFIDIVDDCIFHCLHRKRLASIVAPWNLQAYVGQQKDALYRALKDEKEKFLDIARRFGYPRIAGREKEFVVALHELISERAVKLLGAGRAGDNTDILQVLRLAELLSLCSDIEIMELTNDAEEGALIDGLSVFYHNRGELFPHSVHIFDEESSVQKELLAMGGQDGLPPFKCKFVKSDNSLLTQVSDVIAGLFAKYFDFLDNATSEALVATRAALTPLQLETLELMKLLIEKSHDECMYLLHYVTADSVQEKHRQFMFPEEG